ncbi:MAG: hypothetical protein HW383_39 [Candidatus Magasanikbacteria bacterium]|nr:hypothetical protein [Candidatus Magasanikbacteria bacterium]
MACACYYFSSSTNKQGGNMLASLIQDKDEHDGLAFITYELVCGVLEAEANLSAHARREKWSPQERMKWANQLSAYGARVLGIYSRQARISMQCEEAELIIIVVRQGRDSAQQGYICPDEKTRWRLIVARRQDGEHHTADIALFALPDKGADLIRHLKRKKPQAPAPPWLNEGQNGIFLCVGTQAHA